jgi:hypothetical protein
MRSFPLAAALALTACDDLQFRYSGAVRPEPDDTDAPDTDVTDTDVTDTDAPDTDVPDPTACPDTWPDLRVASGECAEPPGSGWTLVEHDRTALPYTFYRAGVGRILDDDGDGDIDQDDRPAIVAVGGDTIGLYAVVLDADLSLVSTAEGGVNNTDVVVGAVDPAHDGDQFLHYTWRATVARVTWHDPDPYAVTTVTERGIHPPLLTDLEGDGSAELILGPEIRDAATGTLLRTLETDFAAMSFRVADLDRDGEEEIIGLQADTLGWYTPGIWSADGTWRGPLPVTSDGQQWPGFAVGDLDGDPQGEIVFAWRDELAILDTDGSLLASTPAAIDEYPYLVSVAQLDADPDREIVVLTDRGVAAWDRDLTPMWEYVASTPNRFKPFVVADLDGGGAHEVVLHDGDTLRVLDGSGAELASVATLEAIDPFAAPMIVDLDGDGLSEIVISGEGGAAVISLVSGGFPVPDARENWGHSWGTFPGSRAPDGTVPGTTADPFWSSPNTNVFQGTALGSSDAGPDLAVESAEICDIVCSGTSTMAAYVGNRGGASVEDDVTVQLWSDAALLGEATLAGPLEPGVSRPVTFEVETTKLDGALRVSVAGGASLVECDDGVSNELAVAPVDCE